MKQVVALLTGLIFIYASQSQANEICTTRTVMMIINDNGTFDISTFGQSRNTYAATYKVAQKSGGISNGLITLVKVNDDSTWEDMPPKLLLQYAVSILPGYYYKLEGLFKESVNFNPLLCELEM